MRIAILSLVVLGCTVAAHAASPGFPRAEAQGSMRVRVVLQPMVRTTSSVVTVGEIAQLRDGPEQLRDQIARLDVVDLPNANVQTLISREQIAIRIQLANVAPEQFEVDGPSHVKAVRIREQATPAEVVGAVRKMLLQRLPWSPEDVTIQLTQPVQVPLIQAAETDDIRLEPNLPNTTSLSGRLRADVAILVNGEKRVFVPVYVEVRVMQDVAVARRRIEAGEPLNETNIHVDRRALTGTENYTLYKDAIVGKRAKRLLNQGQVLSQLDLETATSVDPILVKQREMVRVVARPGNLKLTTLGEALQDGKAGQLIRIRNLDSKKEIVGRVIDRSIVEVDF